MLEKMLVQNKITSLDEAQQVALLKRGSRRSESRKTPVISAWLDHEKIMRQVDEIEIGLMKRGSRRSEIRQRQTAYQRPEIIIAFPVPAAALPVAANN